MYVEALKHLYDFLSIFPLLLSGNFFYRAFSLFSPELLLSSFERVARWPAPRKGSLLLVSLFLYLSSPGERRRTFI